MNRRSLDQLETTASSIQTLTHDLCKLRRFSVLVRSWYLNFDDIDVSVSTDKNKKMNNLNIFVKK